MFFSLKLKNFQNIKHCFFSRKDGVSEGIYKSLNCGLGSNDEKENVIKNLKIVSEKINCESKFLITLNQVHSNKVVHFKNEKSIKNKLHGDAIISEVKNVGIAILSADCAPILFYDPNRKIIGCAHAGWKGALNGIIKNTVSKFNELNSNNRDLIAVIGPCIKMENYEVGNDFLKNFINKDKNNEVFFKKKNKEKYTFDLRAFINKELNSLNIKNIENIDLDTFSQSDFFYSHRRSIINNEKDYGRCISVILMT
tara:strand:+ start:6126 stop:6887 length:762 start_codon:yes stop_codon:yes gene_type:complete